MNQLMRAGMLVTLFLSACGCLPVPLGDAEKSKADSSYAGAWEWREGQTIHVAVIRPYDERTFVTDVLTFTRDAAGKISPESRNVFKTWLTTVKGNTFMTLQPIETLTKLNGETGEKVFLVCRVKLQGDNMTATGIDARFAKLKDVGTATELERVIGENLDDVKMYVKDIVAMKWGAEQMKELGTLQKAFENLK